MPALFSGAIDPAAGYLLSGQALLNIQAVFDALENAEVKPAGSQGARFIFAGAPVQKITLLTPGSGGSGETGGEGGGVDPATLTLITVDLCLPGGGTVTAQLAGRLV